MYSPKDHILGPEWEQERDKVADDLCNVYVYLKLILIIKERE